MIIREVSYTSIEWFEEWNDNSIHIADDRDVFNDFELVVCIGKTVEPENMDK